MFRECGLWVTKSKSCFYDVVSSSSKKVKQNIFTNHGSPMLNVCFLKENLKPNLKSDDAQTAESLPSSHVDCIK